MSATREIAGAKLPHSIGSKETSGAASFSAPDRGPIPPSLRSGLARRAAPSAAPSVHWRPEIVASTFVDLAGLMPIRTPNKGSGHPPSCSPSTAARRAKCHREPTPPVREHLPAWRDRARRFRHARQRARVSSALLPQTRRNLDIGDKKVPCVVAARPDATESVTRAIDHPLREKAAARRLPSPRRSGRRNDLSRITAVRRGHLEIGRFVIMNDALVLGIRTGPFCRGLGAASIHRGATLRTQTRPARGFARQLHLAGSGDSGRNRLSADDSGTADQPYRSLSSEHHRPVVLSTSDGEALESAGGQPTSNFDRFTSIAPPRHVTDAGATQGCRQPSGTSR